MSSAGWVETDYECPACHKGKLHVRAGIQWLEVGCGHCKATSRTTSDDVAEKGILKSCTDALIRDYRRRLMDVIVREKPGYKT